MEKITLEEIAASENDLETLKALRQKIAAAIDKSNSGRDIAALSRQLSLVLDSIREMESQDKHTEIEDLLAKRDRKLVRPVKPY